MLKYKTEQFVAKINAPIACKFNGDEILFENGKELADYQFDKRYVIDVITVENGKAVVSLVSPSVSNINSIRDEQAAGDDWIKEHIKHYGKEPNLFDGV